METNTHGPTHTNKQGYRHLPINWKKFQDTWMQKLEYLEAWEFVHQEIRHLSSPVLFRWVWFLYGLGHLLSSYHQVSDYTGILRLVYPVEESKNEIPKFHKEFVQFFSTFFETLYSFCSTETCTMMCRTQWEFLSYYPAFAATSEYPDSLPEKLAPEWNRIWIDCRHWSNTIKHRVWLCFYRQLSYCIKNARPDILDLFPLKLPLT